MAALMEFYQLEDLIAVAEEGSFSRAAARVFRTQSAVSQAIKKLEDELGVPLLDRTAGTLIPTQAGQLVLDHARRISGQREQFLQELDALKKARSGKVTIAAFESAALYMLPAALSAFHKRFPGVEIEVVRRVDEVIPHEVRERVADLGVVVQEPPFIELGWVRLFEDPLILVMSPTHRLAGRMSVEVNELAGEAFLVHHVRTQTTRRVLALFEARGTPIHIAARLWSYENVKGFVKEGIGIAILPAVCVESELREGSLVCVQLTDGTLSRTVGLIYADEARLPASARELLALLQNWNWNRFVLASGRSLTEGAPGVQAGSAPAARGKRTRARSQVS